MKKISTLLIFLFTAVIFYAQQKIKIDSNINQQELNKRRYYNHIQPYENENFFYMGLAGIVGNNKGVLVTFNKNQKVKKVIQSTYNIKENITKKDSSIYILNFTEVKYHKKDLKNLGKQLRSILWNNYSKEIDSNFYCISNVDSSLEYQAKKYNTLSVDDGFLFYCVLKIGHKYRLLNFYIWEDFVGICNDVNHKKVLKLMRKLLLNKAE